MIRDIDETHFKINYTFHKKKKNKQAIYCAYITYIFRYTIEDMSCFMLKRNQQLNLPYRVICILKFLIKHCKLEFFFLICCFNASCNVLYYVSRLITLCVSLVSVFFRECQFSACYMLMHPV